MGTEIAVVEPEQRAGLSLIEGPDPATAVAYARQVSGVIASVLEEKSGYVTIQGKRHITIEGWQTLAAMTGHTVEVEWSRPIAGVEPVNGRHAWEARAVAHDQNGRVVASGEAMASPSESAPWTRNDFSIRSMAQTRAMSRALSSRMRYIVTLAGFAGTPAEEMPDGPAPAADPLAVARERFKVLREESETDNDYVKTIVGDDPARLAQDDFFANAAYRLGWKRAMEQENTPEGTDDAPVDGEVVEEPETPAADHDARVADEVGQQTLGAEHLDPS